MTDLNHLEQGGVSSARSNRLFNEQWQLYQKVLNNNYLGHREVYRILHEFLARYEQKPFKMLDLGCGDASFVAQALMNTTITFYQGIDLSKAALAIARDNMVLIHCQKMFIQGDFFELVPKLAKNQQDSFDVVLASFSLHHLTLEQKDYLMSQLLQLLKDNSVFLLIDPMCQEGESREAYLKRYLEWVQQEWSLLTSQEVLMVEDHISANDFPETQKTLRLIAQKHGFLKVDCLYQNLLNSTQLLCFYT